MKYQSWKKVLACVLVGLVVLGCLSACGETSNEETKKSTQSAPESTKSESTEASTEEGSKQITYPLEGNVKLTIAVVEEANVAANAENLGETSFGKAWQEQTGVELEFITLPSKDAMGLMLAGGELPDIILAYNGFPNGVPNAIKNNVIEPIENYAEYMPDMMAILEENEMWRKLMTIDGQIYCAPMILEDEYLQVSSGLIIRSDWLEDLKMDIPKTADDLYEVLKAFKEKKGAEVPFSLTPSFLTWQGLGQGCLTSGQGLVRGHWYAVGEKVHFGYAEKEYKDVLAYFHKLYEEKLLDQNFQTIDSATVKANFMNGKSGVTFGAVGSGIGTYLDTMKDDPTFDVAGFTLAEEGMKPLSTSLNAPANNLGAYITTQCKNKEVAAMFLNYGYTEAGITLFNFGTENVSYTMVDGQPTYTDLIQKPEGMTKIQALAYYTRIPQNGPFVQQKEYMEQYNNKPQQQAALASWSDTDASEYYVPSSWAPYLSSEEFAELDKLMGDIETYISEMTMKYITGIKSLDTFETEYLATLERMKMSRAIEVAQKAFDVFNAQ